MEDWYGSLNSEAAPVLSWLRQFDTAYVQIFGVMRYATGSCKISYFFLRGRVRKVGFKSKHMVLQRFCWSLARTF